MDNNNVQSKQPKQQQQSSSLNMGQLLMGRQKQQQIPLKAKETNKIASTPSNIKRLQVNKWFNSPTDSMFSPCSKKLYNKKNIGHIVHFDEADYDDNNANNDDLNEENDENGQQQQQQG
uniref:Probable serine/threonine-protein kinase cdc7 n=1 Tax=Dermatophagoides pteronyssinus TaxID=6956 RepID=A0A6P6XY57_DERPT|nr:probable serine/threonine-protein kinase cdc7 [Dermatophagoides pteronyssinus]